MNFIEEFEKIGKSEVQKHLANGVYGDSRNPKFLAAKTWLDSKKLEREEALSDESLSISRKALAISEDANSIAADANLIARNALSASKAANIWAAIATLIAVIAMYMAYIKTP